MNVKEQLKTGINAMSNGQAASLLLFMNAMQNSFQKQMHGSKSTDDFDADDVKAMSRIIENMYTNDIETARNAYRIAATIVDREQPDSDPVWNECVIIAALYMLGIEEGKRTERQKKKATDGNQ